MRHRAIAALIIAVAAVSPAATRAAALYTEAFDSDVSANWTTTQGPGTNTAEFGFDYSTLGIPKATAGQTDTRGLRLTPNTTGVTTAQALTGLSTSPNGQSFTGDYVVRFNAWQNYGGSGTTVLTTYGVGATGTTSQRPGGTIEGVLFGATSDGGSTSDYRAYGPGTSGAPIATAGTYPAGSQNHNASAAVTAYYESVFPGPATSPPVQGAVQTAPDGTPAFTWQLVEIYKVGTNVNWVINGKAVALVNASSFTFAGSNISLGASDINNTAASTPSLVFGLIDNLTVDTTVPEPTSLAALAMGGLLIRRRK